MPDSEAKQLDGFIAKFSPEIAARTNSVLKKMRERYPTAQVLVYDNYNALAIGFAPGEKAAEAIFSIAVFPRRVSLFFLQAEGVPDPEGLLKGSGKVARHVVLGSPEDLELPAIRAMMEAALEVAKTPLAAKGEGRLIIKSVSAKQRPRRPAAK
ncbi:MAG TPA: hypothetical protein VK814_07205 [Acidobacteriaceae bacterium]|jgi:hypothetical protein|nr:hypothetical protein [Acidobacteriaceae bacterium]